MSGSEGSRGGSGAAGVVAGLLLVGLLIMGAATAVFFVAHANQQAELQAREAKEREARVQAERKEAEAEARAKAEHERAVAAERAQAEHEAKQIAALHAQELERAQGAGEQEAGEKGGVAPRPSGGSPIPEVSVGTSLVFVQNGTAMRGKVLAWRGPWFQIATTKGSRVWVNFNRVDSYEVLAQ